MMELSLEAKLLAQQKSQGIDWNRIVCTDCRRVIGYEAIREEGDVAWVLCVKCTEKHLTMEEQSTNPEFEP